MSKSLAERQRQMKMRTKGIPQPKLTRTEALNQLAAEIEQLPPGAEKAAALARYVGLKGRRRVTKVKHVTNRAKPEPQADADDGLREPTEEWLHSPAEIPSTCVRCADQYVWQCGINDSQLCDDCYAKWIEQRRLSGVPVT